MFNHNRPLNRCFDDILRAGRTAEEVQFRESIRHLTPERQEELLSERKLKEQRRA